MADKRTAGGTEIAAGAERKRRPPYPLFAALGLSGALLVAAALLVILGHPGMPGSPVILPLHAASEAAAATDKPPAPAQAVAAPSALSSGVTPAGLPQSAAAASLPGQPAAAAVPAVAPAASGGATPASKMPLGHPVPLAAAQPGAAHDNRALAPAPDPDLIERGQYGFIPTAGKGDDRPWKVYARPFDANDQRPRLAILIVGLGISQSATDAAIRTVPPEMSLAFVPFARRLGQWMNLARGTGHETLLELPMEPVNYPDQDPGYNALLTALSPKQNLDRLSWVMSQAAGYVGLVGRLGGRFSASSEAMKPVLEDIGKRGLIYIDNRPTAQTVVGRLAPAAGLPYADINRYIDMDPNPAAIDQNLNELEDLAKRKGYAIGAASSNHTTLARLQQWAAGLGSRGIALAPVTAVVAQSSASNSGKADTQ